jgi:23S rRNA pseudouridine1911/1915/1917 synthase
MLVHPTSSHHTNTLAHGLAHYLDSRGLGARIRPVHRLDRDTSGALLVAKSAFAHQRLDRQLREGTLEREYLAVVEGMVRDDEGTIDLPIGIPRMDPRLREVRADGRPAVTRYRVVDRLDGATQLRVKLETGRTHQIRVHMAAIGHPIVGDRSYGAAMSPWISRPALHAWRLNFRRPRSGEPVTVVASVPADFESALQGHDGVGAMPVEGARRADGNARRPGPPPAEES